MDAEEVAQYEDIEKMQELGVNAQDVKRLKEAGQLPTHSTHSLSLDRSIEAH